MSRVNTRPCAGDRAPDDLQASRQSSSGSVLSTFVGAEGGNVLIMFSLMATVVVSMVGGAVDYGRWLNARNQTQNALDSAVLGGGRTLQSTYGDGAAAVTAANNYYSKMKSQIAFNDTVTFVSTNSNTAIEARGNAFVKTPFLSVIGIDQLPLLYVAEVKQAESTIAQGGNSGTNIEVSVMLDITGSMGPGYGDGKKLIDLKAAAKDLIDIVVWADQSAYTSKIALAPFSSSVNVGTYAVAVTGRPATASSSSPVLTASGGNEANGLSAGTGTLRPCVIERLGANAYTDEPPSATNGWIGSHGANNAPSGFTYNDSLSSSDWDYISNGICAGEQPPTAAAIVPLTNNKAVLKATIDALTPQGGTAGHLGTAWAWYLISPKWSAIWPAASTPRPYSQLTAIGATGQPVLRKIAILMTDGEYNTDYSTGESQAKAEQLCTRLKATGIEVYSVGFQLSTAAKTFLKTKCSTNDSYFYDATNGEALRVAFRDIALKISNLRLSF